MAVLLQMLPAAADYDLFAHDGPACAQGLDQCLPDTFEDDDSVTVVRVSYWDDGRKSFSQQECCSGIAVQQDLSLAQNSKLKIISIPQQFSYGPLSISKASMQQILTTCNVDVAFGSVIAAFGQPPRISEPGYDCFAFTGQADNDFTISYLYRFVERDNSQEKWSDIGKFRQIGVYHAYQKATDSSLWMFLQPHPDSNFDTKLEMISRVPESTQTLLREPLRLHEVLIRTYFDNWRWYLFEIAQDFKDESDKVITADITRKDFEIKFDSLQTWRDLADRIMPLTAYLEALTRVLEGLGKFETDYSAPMGEFLSSHKSLLCGNIAGAKILQQRIQGVIDLLANTIDVKNQQDSAELNSHLYNLTLDTVDDSATVKVITVVTLIYLPASFIGTVFGMNLFVFNPQTRRIVISRDFWIYVAIFLPLTVFTFFVWFLLVRNTKAKRQLREQGQLKVALR